MAEKVANKPVSVDAIDLSTESDCLTIDSVNTDAINSAQFSREDLYKHALQFYKGRQLLALLLYLRNRLLCRETPRRTKSVTEMLDFRVAIKCEKSVVIVVRQLVNHRGGTGTRRLPGSGRAGYCTTWHYPDPTGYYFKMWPNPGICHDFCDCQLYVT